MPPLTNKLFKVATGSTGPGGPIFDIFDPSGHISDPNDPRLTGVNLSGLPEGQAPEGFESEFLPVEPSAVGSTVEIRNNLTSNGLVPSDVEDVNDQAGLDAIVDRFEATDDIVSRIVEMAGPDPEIQQVEADIEELENILREQVQEAQERPLDGTILKSGLAAEINNIVSGNTRQSLVILRRMDNLNRKLTRLQGDKKAQLDVLKLEYDLRRQSTADAMAFYQLTRPERLFIDESEGAVYMQNPITNEVFKIDIPGFTPNTGLDSTSAITEYLFAQKEGFEGDFVDYQAFKATQFGTEDTPTDDDKKVVDRFNDSLSSWNGQGTREQFIRQLRAKFPGIDPNDIAIKVYQTYPDDFNKQD